MDISKFMASGSLGHNTFLNRINTFGEKNILLFKKSRKHEKLVLQKQL